MKNAPESKPKNSTEVMKGKAKFIPKPKFMMGAGARVSNTSDGSTADYYKLPPRCKQLQDLISGKDMNAQLGEIFRAAYRYGEVAHSDKARDMRKIIFYAKAELKRLEALVLLDDL